MKWFGLKHDVEAVFLKRVVGYFDLLQICSGSGARSPKACMVGLGAFSLDKEIMVSQVNQLNVVNCPTGLKMINILLSCRHCT